MHTYAPCSLAPPPILPPQVPGVLTAGALVSHALAALQRALPPHVWRGLSVVRVAWQLLLLAALVWDLGMGLRQAAMLQVASLVTCHGPALVCSRRPASGARHSKGMAADHVLAGPAVPRALPAVIAMQRLPAATAMAADFANDSPLVKRCVHGGCELGRGRGTSRSLCFLTSLQPSAAPPSPTWRRLWATHLPPCPPATTPHKQGPHP